MSKNKKIVALISLVALLIVAVLTGCGTSNAPATNTSAGTQNQAAANNPAPVKPIELKYATYVASNHYMADIDRQMFKRIEDQTGGKLKFSQFYDGSLINPTQWYQELLKGSADIAQGPAGSEKDRFALENSMSFFIYGVNDVKTLLDITRQLWAKSPDLQAEYKDVIPLSRITAGESWIHTVKKPIRSAADFKGLNIKVADDPSTALVKALGANPIKMPISEAYSALEKGTIDGVLTGPDPLNTFKFAEVTKYSTKLPYLTPWVYSKVMNKDSWNKLTPDEQKVIMDNSTWWEDQLVTSVTKQGQAGIDAAKKHNNEIIELPKAEQDKILAIMEDNAKKVAADLDAKGKKGTQLFNDARALVQQKTK